jgi:hypothetical protein
MFRLPELVLYQITYYVPSFWRWGEGPGRGDYPGPGVAVAQAMNSSTAR